MGQNVRSPRRAKVLLAVLFLIACAWAVPKLVVSDLARGKRLFDAHCARCHGAEGHGGVGTNLAAAELPRASNDEQLFSVIEKGIPDTLMPGNAKMTDDEIRLVIGYVWSLRNTSVKTTAGDAEKAEATR